ncbi:MAG: dephospho-CoA kinase [Ilumatobacteraceae bacterium]|nr:dephospho-CoA kinase [Ilumatobacteraceae bacterium]MBP7887636.1 dephospho-CoA kinase [Ilumatobacteraceae bacterium]MBP8207970.1 dephospho-CoA kinase [Ilumatobacteraceae bacterium]
MWGRCPANRAVRRCRRPRARAYLRRQPTLPLMILVGLTGGIGSGKSTVSAALAARGAVIVDADQVVRDVQQPGSPVLAKLAERFGAQVIAADGSLDRPALAAIAFADPDALKDLNGIVHPAVGAEMNRQVMQHVASERVVVLDIPLLTENPREGLQGKIVVDVPLETQVDRLVRFRGFDEADARARISRQATREQRLEGAGFVVDNSGDTAALAPQIEQLWRWLQSLPQLPADYQFAGRKDGVDKDGVDKDGVDKDGAAPTA